jgi:hypothetical protein
MALSGNVILLNARLDSRLLKAEKGDILASYAE